jgi:hypothetical protein
MAIFRPVLCTTTIVLAVLLLAAVPSAHGRKLAQVDIG